MAAGRKNKACDCRRFSARAARALWMALIKCLLACHRRRVCAGDWAALQRFCTELSLSHRFGEQAHGIGAGDGLAVRAEQGELCNTFGGRPDHGRGSHGKVGAKHNFCRICHLQ